MEDVILRMALPSAEQTNACITYSCWCYIKKTGCMSMRVFVLIGIAYQAKDSHLDPR